MFISLFDGHWSEQFSAVSAEYQQVHSKMKDNKLLKVKSGIGIQLNAMLRCSIQWQMHFWINILAQMEFFRSTELRNHTKIFILYGWDCLRSVRQPLNGILIFDFSYIFKTWRCTYAYQRFIHLTSSIERVTKIEKIDLRPWSTSELVCFVN